MNKVEQCREYGAVVVPRCTVSNTKQKLPYLGKETKTATITNLQPSHFYLNPLNMNYNVYIQMKSIRNKYQQKTLSAANLIFG